MKYLIILIGALSFLGCEKNSRIVTDNCSIDELVLTLVQNGSEAFLEHNSNHLKIDGKLQLTPPCFFLRKNGEIQSYEYQDVGVNKVLILIGDIVDNEEKKRFGAPDNAVCGKKIQGVLIQADRIILSEKTISGAINCKDLGLDEKDFWDFAH
jgi:hypothetical protein